MSFSLIVSGWDADGDGQPDPTQPPDSLDIGTPIPTKVFEYDHQSRLSAVILPAVEHPDPTIGFVHPRYEYTHDAQGNLVGIRDNAYQVGSDIYYAHGGTANDFTEHYDTRLTWFTFDVNGRQLTRTLPLGVREEFATTLPDQLPFPETDAARLPFTEYFAYNDLGQQTLHVSFEGIVTAFVYDDFSGSGGRLLEKQFFTGLDAYHAAPSEPDELWSFSYNAFGRQTHVAAYLRDAGTGLLEPARTESNSYDSLGQLIMLASTEGTIHYEYDHLGRHTRTYTGGEDTGGIPDALDGIAVTDTRYSYDALGRLDAITVTERFDQPLATPEVTKYLYTLMGNLAQVRLPNGVIADYQYDDLNRLELLRHFRDINSSGAYEAGVDALLAEYAYDLLPDGRRAGVTEKIWLDADEDGIFDPSELAGTRIDWTYDPVGRLVRESYDSHDDSLDYVTDYLFDLVGNRLFKLTDTDPDWVALGEGLPTSPDQSVAYSYDINDRLLVETAATWDGGTLAWITDRTTVYEYGPNADPTEGIGGNHTMQTRKTVWGGTDTDPATGTRLADSTFGYNLQNRLSGALIDPDGDGPQPPVESRYAYNTSGIRVQKVEGTDKVLYLVDGNNPTGYAQVLEELAWEQEAWHIIRAFTLGLDVISHGESTGEIYHLLYDGHGSTRALLDTAGLIIPGQIFGYDAYGNAHGFDPAALTNYLYAGEQFDQRLQMQYLRARYYDPATGRFNRLDPFFGRPQDPLSLHKYGYAHADPVRHTDPSGEAVPAVLRSIIRKLVSSGRSRLATESGGWALAKALIGIRATYTLGRAYIAENGRDPSNVDINHAIARLDDPDLPIEKTSENFVETMKRWRARPDIVDHTFGAEQLYEIKSFSLAASGASEVLAYQAELNLRYPGLTYNLGLWDPLRRTYFIDAAYGLHVPLRIQAWRSAPGVIVYETNGDEDHILRALIAAEAANQIARVAINALSATAASEKSLRPQHAWATSFLVAAMIGF